MYSAIVPLLVIHYLEFVFDTASQELFMVYFYYVWLTLLRNKETK